MTGSKPAADYTGIWQGRDKRWVYVEKGETATDYTGAVTGIIDKEEGTYYFENGVYDKTYTGLGTSEEGWLYFTKGVADDTYKGFAQAADTWYWVEGGAVDLSFTGVQEGTINGDESFWYVEDGEADLKKSGAVETKYGIWYFQNGQRDYDFNGIQKIGKTWYYFTKGAEDKNFEGVATNDNGVWYVKDGKVDFSYSGKVNWLGRNYKVKDGVVGNGKAVYLTFDDGPGIYTDQLLKILKKHKVKVTFFVTANYKNNWDCLAKEAKAGHAIGVHSYTHNYSKIYKSEKAYWADFEDMEDLIEKETGHRTVIFRFPGGSSNSVSKKYNEGIMSKLTKTADEKGYVYFDWNVLSGDAGDTKDSEQIYKNIVNGCANHTHSVVLCHDIHDFTVNAMDKTITKLLKDGYVLLPLDRNSPTCHQKVNN